MTVQPNLAGAQRKLEQLMADECTITRDVQGTADDTYDPVTMQYTRPSPDDDEVYSGRCMIVPTPLGSRPNSSGTVEDPGSREYTLRIPLAADEILLGDLVTMTSSPRDEQLVDRTFLVIGRTVTTFAACRQLDVRAAR